MNGEPDDETLDEGQDAHIRALLAELGSGPDGERMPPEVAARLDDTLARLVAERASTGEVDDEVGSGNVVPLRRRWGSRATTAAAAVVVLGIGGVAAANLGLLDNNGSTMSSDSSAGGASEGQVESAPDSEPTPSAGGDVSARKRTLDTAGLPSLSADSFASDVTRLLQSRTSLVAPDAAPSPASGADEDSGGNTPGTETPQQAKQDGAISTLKARDCPGPEITDGGVPNAVEYDGQLAVLVVHPESEGRQLVEVWTCAGNSKLANATITR